ncbi:glycerol-3-phosphate dehydrogenase/oxidase [Cereibacter sphaeroides]|uniref:glycerol-3-phosphate dehydrogenase/oxidase n=1 Tax=Cereibacter sphaeroides TaxID=1063 RepID=UPI001F1A24E5|nr:glycerol-3-phosphate dehydrogenase/oxidase [Cereibacter sphaeroides]MCE6961768.1 glycerol-3-phosphate dehydrogenase/oxidase [Cereibacter sphaeroides]MCE6970543.1 glycerol-3-phosphate dehydrogenase/oxidase [Cereibacter sphaeroides]MCE6971879.1 glycerol-3-phosphate dehydrogenase/oxidase [Cereibacter sphaeroides]
MRMRDEMLARLRAGDVPDILIVGGGINGVGVFRDLAAQGVPALLVEAGDFSSGTSAAPSRLIHGGLRYLETGEAALVRESLTERNLLLRNACHVVHPLACWVPLRSWLAGTLGAGARLLRLTRTPGRKGAVAVKLGLMLYDAFGRTHQTMPDHRLLTAGQARRELCGLAPDIRAVAEYYDARISHPERLVMELVADAEEDCEPALALNHVSAGRQTQGRVTLTDQLTGETFTVTPKILINAAGAWVDEVQAGLGFNERLIGGTRGSHLVLRHAQLAEDLGNRMLYFETDDHRACLIYRLSGDRVLLGTTDIRSDDPGDKLCTEAEIDYLFAVLRPILPGVRLSRSDIVFAFAGVRPLPRMKAGATGAISRDHRIDEFAPTADRPFVTLALVGGKWTTYRAFAEQVSGRVLARLGLGRRQSTAGIAIGGARGLPFDAAGRAAWARNLAQETGLQPARCATLVDRYGSRARAVAEAEAADPARFDALPDYSPAEIGLICATERVARLDDILLRRTLMGFEGHASRAILREVGTVAARSLGWDAARLAAEIERTATLLRERHRMSIA